MKLRNEFFSFDYKRHKRVYNIKWNENQNTWFSFHFDLYD